MTAVNIAVEERNRLRREADQLDRESNALALTGDKAYEDSASKAAEAEYRREEIRKLNVLIDGLGGEPKQRRKPFKAKAKAVAA